jgi:hypothetical protein
MHGDAEMLVRGYLFVLFFIFLLFFLLFFNFYFFFGKREEKPLILILNSLKKEVVFLKIKG